jgi:hypothetical protein
MKPVPYYGLTILESNTLLSDALSSVNANCYTFFYVSTKTAAIVQKILAPL